MGIAVGVGPLMGVGPNATWISRRDQGWELI